MIDKIKEAKVDENEGDTTNKLKNLLMFFIGVGVIAFVVPELLAVSQGYDSPEQLFTPPPTSSIQLVNECPLGATINEQEKCVLNISNDECNNKYSQRNQQTGTDDDSNPTCMFDKETKTNIGSVIGDVFVIILWVIRGGMVFAALAVAAKMSLFRI